MYYMVKMENTIRIPPEHIGKNLEEVSEKIVQETFESTMDKNNGLILIAKNVQRSGEGKIIHGDGAIYQDVKFDALTFKPELQEIIDGIICDIVEFGAFCHIGPARIVTISLNEMNPRESKIGLTMRQPGMGKEEWKEKKKEGK